MEKTTMSVRERYHEPDVAPAVPTQIGDPGDGELQSMREAGDQMLRTADEVVDRVLSGNSLAYNEASQQCGGQ
jgi:hypothetical protein